MAVQTSTTGDLAKASREMIAKALFTEEHNAPMVGLVEMFQLKQGEDTGVFPKFGQMDMDPLVDGQDMVDSKDLGMSAVSVQTSEVGAKVILTDKLLRQNVAANWQGVGRQLGDAAARRKDEDLLGLFSALNGASDYGATGRILGSANSISAIGRAKNFKMGNDLRLVHHPNAILNLAKDLSVIGIAGGTRYPLTSGFSVERLANFWTGIRLNGTSVFEDGNIDIDASSDGVGAIFAPDAMGILQSIGWRKERQRDASLRAWEMNMTADYAAFEHDDSKGAPLTMACTIPATT